MCKEKKDIRVECECGTAVCEDCCEKYWDYDTNMCGECYSNSETEPIDPSSLLPQTEKKVDNPNIIVDPIPAIDDNPVVSDDGSFYTYKCVDYHIDFPIYWAKNHFEDTGPHECMNCAFYGVQNGLFVAYCRNCARYTYNGERREEITSDRGVIINNDNEAADNGENLNDQNLASNEMDEWDDYGPTFEYECNCFQFDADAGYNSY